MEFFVTANTNKITSEHPFLTALGLSLGAAVSLGISRFSYALLLPPMRHDLGWSYLLAGTMNTANALGYLIGALITPALMRRLSPQTALIGGSLLTGTFMLLSGFFIAAEWLLVQRILAGVASAFIFISGGLLAARLGASHPRRAGLLIGVYYGGTGFGIIVSALIVPFLLEQGAASGIAHGWQRAWLALGSICFLATLGMILPARSIDGQASSGARKSMIHIRKLGFGLAGYFMFGVGYIGYMTFIIALLREQGMQASVITLFYGVLGLAVIASSRIWARMLDYFKGGQSLAILNTLLVIATLLPVLTTAPAAVFTSGVLFGGVFLSVVASSTSLVRHNLPSEDWPAGISMFTIVFAFGQIVGPTIVGWISDGAGGLQRGLIFSAIALFSGALIAILQRPLTVNPVGK